jgi:hypothetical protein
LKTQLLPLCLLMLSACATSTPDKPAARYYTPIPTPDFIRTEDTSPLDGVWVQIKNICLDKPTVNFMKPSDAKHGALKLIAVITGDEVHLTVIQDSPLAAKNPQGRCEMRVREHWRVDPQKSTLTISDSTGESKAIGTAYSDDCVEHFEMRTPRTSPYTLKGDRLEIHRSKSYEPGNQDLHSDCKTGDGLVTFKRVF